MLACVEKNIAFKFIGVALWLLGWHGSASLCRDGQKTKWRLQWKYYRSNANISPIVVNSTRLKTLRSAVRRYPKLYITPRVFKNIAKVTNLEAVKIQFRHLLFLSSFFSQPSALTRAVPKTKHPRIVVKFSWHVHFGLRF